MCSAGGGDATGEIMRSADVPGPVAPGSGWTGDLATWQTPVASSAADVVRLSGNAPTLDHLTARVSVCRACPRLVEWRERVAVERRAAFRDQTYWGRPVTGWGPARARVAGVGLAPAPPGGDPTRRLFPPGPRGGRAFAPVPPAPAGRPGAAPSAPHGARR